MINLIKIKNNLKEDLLKKKNMHSPAVKYHDSVKLHFKFNVKLRNFTMAWYIISSKSN